MLERKIRLHRNGLSGWMDRRHQIQRQAACHKSDNGVLVRPRGS